MTHIICCSWCCCCWIWPCCSMAPWTVKGRREKEKVSARRIKDPSDDLKERSRRVVWRGQQKLPTSDWDVGTRRERESCVPACVDACVNEWGGGTFQVTTMIDHLSAQVLNLNRQTNRLYLSLNDDGRPDWVQRWTTSRAQHRPGIVQNWTLLEN